MDDAGHQKTLVSRTLSPPNLENILVVSEALSGKNVSNAKPASKNLKFKIQNY